MLSNKPSATLAPLNDALCLLGVYRFVALGHIMQLACNDCPV